MAGFIGVVADKGSTVPVVVATGVVAVPDNDVVVVSRPKPVDATGVVVDDDDKGMIMSEPPGVVVGAGTFVPVAADTEAGVLIRLRGVGESICASTELLPPLLLLLLLGLVLRLL